MDYVPIARVIFSKSFLVQICQKPSNEYNESGGPWSAHCSRSKHIPQTSSNWNVERASAWCRPPRAGVTSCVVVPSECIWRSNFLLEFHFGGSHFVSTTLQTRFQRKTGDGCSLFVGELLLELVFVRFQRAQFFTIRTFMLFFFLSSDHFCSAGRWRVVWIVRLFIIWYEQLMKFVIEFVATFVGFVDVYDAQMLVLCKLLQKLY